MVFENIFSHKQPVLSIIKYIAIYYIEKTLICHQISLLIKIIIKNKTRLQVSYYDFMNFDKPIITKSGLHFPSVKKISEYPLLKCSHLFTISKVFQSDDSRSIFEIFYLPFRLAVFVRSSFPKVDLNNGEFSFTLGLFSTVHNKLKISTFQHNWPSIWLIEMIIYVKIIMKYTSK